MADEEAMPLVTDSPERDPDYVIAGDLAERHPQAYPGDRMAAAMAEMEPCPLCGRMSCDEHELAPRQLIAPRERRTDREPTPEVDPVEDPERIVVAKQEYWEERALPGTDRTTHVLMVTKGQQLHLSEALRYRIEWAEQDGPAAFGLYFKNGVPHIEDPDGPHVRFEEGAIHQGAGQDVVEVIAQHASAAAKFDALEEATVTPTEE